LAFKQLLLHVGGAHDQFVEGLDWRASTARELL
jgi:hypothetical protein